MKRLSLLVAIVLVIGTCLTPALALNYQRTLGNESTFETMAEVKVNAPEFFKTINSRGNFRSHAVMEGYPDDTTYVYRSANMFGRNNAARINTNLAVFTDQSFASKDDAKAYLDDLGLIDIIEEAVGSIILVTPSNPATGFGAADQKYYYALQTAMFALNASGTIDGTRYTYYDAQYYGGYGFYYVIGIDGGATFLNNYVASNLDYIGRVAGLLLVNGKMDRIREVASYVPVYLVNADAAIVEKYEAANGTDATIIEGAKKTTYNQVFPVRKVVSLNTATVDLPAIVQDVYYNFFIKAVRGEELMQGMNSASTPYQGYTQDCSPYSLSPRNALINGVTTDGIYEFTYVDERFADIKTTSGEYLQTWYEYLPEEMVNGTAPDGSIPMILTLHGGGDDPRQYVDGQGYLELAGKERIALIAPEKGSLHSKDADGNNVLAVALPAFVRYILETHPAIDASRVYVTGYSMGCIASFDAIFGEPSLFAAAYPQAGIAGVWPTDEQIEKFAAIDVPVVVSTSEYDSPKNVDPSTKDIVPEFYNLLSMCKVLNGLDPLPEADYEAYPTSGFLADRYTESKLGVYTKHSWYFDKDGVPMVGLTFTDSIQHCLYPEYANMVWDFVKHYSRDLTTGAVIYDPYVR